MNKAATPPNRALNRALLFGAALVLLALALQLAPKASTRPDPALYSDDAGTIAATPRTGPRDREDRLFQPGYALVLLVLAGGIGLALYLRRRERTGPAGGLPMRVLGQLTLGPQHHLRLVAVGDEVLLLGLAGGQITLLRTYPRSVLPPEPSTGGSASPAPSAGTSPPPAAPLPFADVLRALSNPSVNTQASPSP
ncbi:MAG: hypothetical protein KatS3mg044_0109 [Rhodothermaceae bacterium]|nr:MAG: hypothetical protein KatS3mg044_0109 [Rhodothermaceae bacterium]